MEKRSFVVSFITKKNMDIIKNQFRDKLERNKSEEIMLVMKEEIRRKKEVLFVNKFRFNNL